MSRVAMYTAVRYPQAAIIVAEFGFAGDVYDKDSDLEVCICMCAGGRMPSRKMLA
jgi:hypothetical protein